MTQLDKLNVDLGQPLMVGVDHEQANKTHIVSVDQFGHLKVSVCENTGLLDAFARLRVTSPTDVFSLKFLYNLRPLITQTQVSGAGSVVKTAGESSATLSVGTASGDLAVIQSKQYVQYHPAKSQNVLMTGILGAQKANVTSRIGYFDASDGMFFEMSGANGARVVQRSSVTGSAVDTAVDRADWNIDKMNGDGPSGFVVDFSKTQIFCVNFQWLGVGIVRYGLFLDSRVLYVHETQNANSLLSPYTNTPCLPVRWELRNTGTAASGTTTKAICAAVHSEGGESIVPALYFTASNGGTPISVTTRRPILSIRPHTTFNSITNRMTNEMASVDILSGTVSVFWELVLNGTLTGASFGAVDANSGMDFDVSATAISGGTVIHSGYVAASTAIVGGASPGTSGDDLLGLLTLTLDLAGTTPDTLSLVITSTGGASACAGAMVWKELR